MERRERLEPNVQARLLLDKRTDPLSPTDTWTIKAIGQDDFSDVPMPDAPAQPGHAPHMSTVKSAGSATQ